MTDIAYPELLDPDRILAPDREGMTVDEHRSRAAELDSALHDSCEYARQLWDRLDAMRNYLVDSLPAAVAPDEKLGPASPTGADDERGWEAWTDAYAGVTSILAGPHGDSGFGLTEARQHVRARLEFTRGRRPTSETVEGIERTPPPGAPEPEVIPAPPPRHATPWEVAALVAGLALGWAARRPRPT